tara:strand:+ start:669 stop:1109 length:441 start_codon:yes stop_codon:yes gene_type:complete
MANLISTEGRNRHSSIQNTPSAAIDNTWVVAKKQEHTICRENADLNTEIPSGVCTVINLELSTIAGAVNDLLVGVFLDAACDISCFGDMTGTLILGKTDATKGTVSIMIGVPFPKIGDHSSVYVLCKVKAGAGTFTLEKSEIQWSM